VTPENYDYFDFQQRKTHGNHGGMIAAKKNLVAFQGSGLSVGANWSSHEAGQEIQQEKVRGS
jgi:hypothetical protein